LQLTENALERVVLSGQYSNSNPQARNPGTSLNQST